MKKTNSIFLAVAIASLSLSTMVNACSDNEPAVKDATVEQKGTKSGEDNFPTTTTPTHKKDFKDIEDATAEAVKLKEEGCTSIRIVSSKNAETGEIDGYFLYYTVS